MRLTLRIAVLALLILTMTAHAQTRGRRRALLIAINDYTASTIPQIPNAPREKRDWADLTGCVNDATILRTMLVHQYGFDANDVLLITDQKATRAAILEAIERHLVAPTRKDDVVFFYFAGHGSRVANSLSDEIDRMDETIVPADSMRGAKDIRDKELRRAFNRIIDRGGRLTLLLDHCHSGSSFRGLPTGARMRGIRPSMIDIRDATDYGPRPEERGALVIAATQDADNSAEDLGDDGKMHGVFSWTFIQAIRDATPNESAQETFQRAQARMRLWKPFQQPVLAGTRDARQRPFLVARTDRRGNDVIVAVEAVQPDGTVIVEGGWANGLSVGCQLRSPNDSRRLTVTRLLDLSRSEARMLDRAPIPPAMKSGALLEVVGWAAPPTRPMRVWAPQANHDIAAFMRTLEEAARPLALRWISDPVQTTPTHVLRPAKDAWELVTADGITRLSEPEVPQAIARIPHGSSLFVQLPIPPAMLTTIAIGDGVQVVDNALQADYILVGRSTNEFAWVRPLVSSDDDSALPARTAWTRGAMQLRDAMLKLRLVFGWQQLESPPNTDAPYRLVVERTSNGERVRGTATGNQTYRIALERDPRRTDVGRRHYYAFVLDSHGRSYLVFPSEAGGSVENRFPIGDAEAKIDLAQRGEFNVQPPYGVDTYFLLSTEEPLPNPTVLAWDGVRALIAKKPLSPLEQLILRTIDPTRGNQPIITARWSIERVTIESVAPRHKAR